MKHTPKGEAMRKFLAATALVAVVGCGEKTDAGMEDTTTMAPAAAPVTVPDSTTPAAPDTTHAATPDSAH
jgi:hypothetical protein